MKTTAIRGLVGRSVRSGISKQGIYAIQIATNSFIGYLFSRVLAQSFGTSESVSGCWIAYSVPFIIMSVSSFKFLYGIVGSLFTRMRVNESNQINEVFSSLLNLIIITGAALFLLGLVSVDILAEILGPGLSPSVKSETKTLILWMLPLVITFEIGTYFGSVFTAYNVPITTEFVFTSSRLGFVAYGILFINRYTLVDASRILLIASIVSLIIEWIILSRVTGLRYLFILKPKLIELKDVWGQMIGFIVAAVLSQINASYTRRLATIDSPSTVAALTYGSTVIQPLGVLIGKSLSFTSGPKFISLYENGKYRSALKLILQYLAICMAITLVTAFIINQNLTLAVRLLYEGGSFDEKSVIETVSLAGPILWSLPGLAILWVVLFPLVGKRKSLAGALIYSIGYLFQIGLNYFLFPKYGRDVLAWGISMSVILQALLGVIYSLFAVYSLMKRKDGHRTASS